LIQNSLLSVPHMG